MDDAAFASDLAARGFTDIDTRTLAPGSATDAHAHAFDVRALVVAGEITLGVDGVETRYPTGKVFTMENGRAHTETVGAEGVTYVVGRRYARHA